MTVRKIYHEIIQIPENRVTDKLKDTHVNLI